MKRHSGFLVTCVVLAALLQACASTKVRLQSGDKPKDFGIPFREPLPYLLVTSEVVLERSIGELYIYDVANGFIPVCDSPIASDADLATRMACVARLKRLRTVGAEAPKVEPKPPEGPVSSRRWPDASIVFASQRLGAAPEAVLTAVSKATTTRKTTGGKPDAKADAKPDAKGGATSDDPFAVATPAKEDPSANKGKDAGTPDPSAGATTQAPLQIVYLPSHCRVYGIDQTNFLASTKLTISLTNGWQLTSVATEGDATAVVGKLLDTVASVVGALKGVPSTGSTGTGAKAGGGGATQQGAPEDLYARVTTKYLSPGVYPLTICDPNGNFSEIKMPGPTGTRSEWVLVIAKEGK